MGFVTLNASTRVAIVLMVLAAGSVLHATSQEEAATDERLSVLIEQLGDPRYAERRSASRELEPYGLRAFEALRAAQDHPDPEVVAASDQLLALITKRVDRPSDAPDVRSLLRASTARDDEGRLAVLRALSRLRAIPVLCRLARFDRSDRFSKEAAITLLTSNEWRFPDERRQAIRRSLSDMRARYGASSRIAAQWLWSAVGGEGTASPSPSEAVVFWRVAARSERRLNEAGSSQTSGRIERTLTDWWLRAALEAADKAQALAALKRHAELNPGDSAVQRLRRPLGWIAEARQLETARDALAAFKDQLHDRRGWYLQAWVLQELGDESPAKVAADRAFGLGTASARLARWLRSAGANEWAEREIAAAGATIEPLTLEAIDARWLLSSWRFDAGEYAEAATTLVPLVEALTKLPATSQWYAENEGAFSPDSVEEIASRRWLAEGLARAADGDNVRAAEALERAYNHQGEEGLADADVLIAMYRLDPPRPDYRAEVIQRIERLAEKLDEQVLAQPDEAIWLNYWAWLVGNTVGDYAKAVRYSKRSLELMTDQPGLLDTLARCQYASGDLQGAVATQRRAVALEPGAQVMQRQLREVENALASEQGRTP